MITIHHYIVLSFILFTLGLLGLVIRKNLLVMFMCIEVMLNAANLAIVALSRYFGRMEGHVVVFFVMAVAAAEAAVGLALLLTVYRNRKTVISSDLTSLGG